MNRVNEIKTTGQSDALYDSAQRKFPALAELREAFRYRHLLLQLVRRDVLTRYKRSILGIAWTLLNPLGMMLVLTVAFSQIFRFGDIRSYPAYVLSGLLAWTFFQQTTTASIVNLIWGGGLLNRIYIPRSSFALSAVGTGIVNLSLSILPLLLVILLTGLPLTPAIVFLPVSMLMLACFSLGVGLLVSTVAVYFPDVAEMYQIFLTAWMYLTPVIYPEQVIPEVFRRWITVFNPMYYLVRLYRLPVYDGRLPTWGEFLPAATIALVTLLLGWWLFSSKSDEFAYRI
jgi:ABC-type polysaccharide/polyol phosphate export permease